MTKRVAATYLSASGIVGSNPNAGPLWVYGIIATETAGTTNETCILYVPANDQFQNPAAPSASGTKIGEIIVPKGTTLGFYFEEGIFFPWGLYAALAGGTPAFTFLVN